MATQAAVEQCGVKASRQSDRQRQSGVLQPADQGQVERLCHAERQNADLDRRADILAGIKTGRQHLDKDHAQQADAVGDQRIARHEHVMGGKGPVMEERGDQRHGDDRQCYGSGRGQQKGQAQAPVEQL